MMDWLQKNLIKVILALLATIVLAVVVVIYLNMGGTRETQIAIPEVFVGSEIIFNKQVYYIPNTRKDTPSLENIVYRISVSETNLNEAVLGGNKFKVVNALNVAQYGLISVDSGTSGVNYLILEDEKKNRSVIPDFNYPNSDYITPPAAHEFPNNASVYRNGQKIGEVLLGQ